MKKLWKRAASLAMAAVMSTTIPATANAEEAVETVVEYSSLEEYVEYAIPHYIRAQAVDVNGTFYYSNPIDIYDINNIDSGSIGECVFLFDDDEIIGKMQVWQADGEYVSVFDTYITDEIRGSFEDNYAISFGYYNDDFYSYDEVAGSTFADGQELEVCPDYELPLNDPIQKAASMDLAAIPTTYATKTNVNIKHIGNTTCDYNRTSQCANTPYEDHYLCWAACIAMMVNYRDNSSLTAKNAYRAAMTSSVIDPNGDIASVRRSLDSYQYYYAVTGGGISASEIYYALSTGHPVYIEINGYKTSDGSDACHAVVICGLSIDNATSSSADITYTVDDPNLSYKLSYLVKASPADKVNSISYTPSGYKYTSIQRTIY